MKILHFNPDNGVTRNFMPHLWKEAHGEWRNAESTRPTCEISAPVSNDLFSSGL